MMIVKGLNDRSRKGRGGDEMNGDQNGALDNAASYLKALLEPVCVYIDEINMTKL